MFHTAAGTTLWVTVTNVFLAVVTAGGLAVVLGAGLRDLFGRRREADAAIMRRLGVTLQDGGEPIDEMKDLREAGENPKR